MCKLKALESQGQDWQEEIVKIDNVHFEVKVAPKIPRSFIHIRRRNLDYL